MDLVASSVKMEGAACVSEQSVNNEEYNNAIDTNIESYDTSSDGTTIKVENLPCIKPDPEPFCEDDLCLEAGDGDSAANLSQSSVPSHTQGFYASSHTYNMDPIATSVKMEGNDSEFDQSEMNEEYNNAIDTNIESYDTSPDETTIKFEDLPCIKPDPDPCDDDLCLEAGGGSSAAINNQSSLPSLHKVDVKGVILKERKSQVPSDLATTDSETANNKKRHRHIPQKLITSDSGSSSEDDLPMFNPKYELKRKRKNSPTATKSSQNPRKSNSLVDMQLARMQGQINSIETTVLQNKICLTEILELLRERKCCSSLNDVENKVAEDSSTLEKKFPMKCLDDVMQFENQLVNEEDTLKQMKVYLRRIGGVTVEDMTKRILVSLFTDGAAREFSWEGRGGKKRSLKELNLIKLIGRFDASSYSYNMDPMATSVKMEGNDLEFDQSEMNEEYNYYAMDSKIEYSSPDAMTVKIDHIPHVMPEPDEDNLRLDQAGNEGSAANFSQSSLPSLHQGFDASSYSYNMDPMATIVKMEGNYTEFYQTEMAGGTCSAANLNQSFPPSLYHGNEFSYEQGSCKEDEHEQRQSGTLVEESEVPVEDPQMMAKVIDGCKTYHEREQRQSSTLVEESEVPVGDPQMMMAKVIDGCKTYFREQRQSSTLVEESEVPVEDPEMMAKVIDGCKTYFREQRQSSTLVEESEVPDGDPQMMTAKVIDGCKTYYCQVCPYKTTVHYSIRMHLYIHTGEKPLKCSFCAFSCIWHNDLKRHMTTHNGVKSHKCSVCAYRCNQAGALKRHMYTHSGEKNFSCSLCPFRCSLSGSLRKHMITHTGDKPFECTVCTFRCSQAGNLKTHMIRHSGDKPHVCSFCSYRCSLSGDLKRHMAIHNGTKPLMCSICPYRCIRTGHLKNHMKTHTKEKPFECPLCLFRFSNSGGLKTHMLTHYSEKRHKCSECSFECSQSGNLKTHMLTHSGDKPHECSLCSFRCSQHGNLKNHMATHTKERPFKCPVCSKRFRQPANLKSHMITHTKDKPHVCSECSFRSSHPGNLKTHMATHIGLRLYKCNICSHSFSQSGSLKIHMLTHSGDKPHQCVQCSFRCSSAGNLKTHMATHSTDRPFHCNQCDYRCSLKHALTHHVMRRHSGQRPYACAHCQYKTVTKAELAKHLSKKHKLLHQLQ